MKSLKQYIKSVKELELRLSEAGLGAFAKSMSNEEILEEAVNMWLEERWKEIEAIKFG